MGRYHGPHMLRVCNDLDVGLRVGAALHVPPQHAPSWGALLPAAGAKHDPVHCQRRVLLVFLEEAMQRCATARAGVCCQWHMLQLNWGFWFAAIQQTRYTERNSSGFRFSLSKLSLTVCCYVHALLCRVGIHGDCNASIRMPAGSICQLARRLPR